MHLSLSPSPPSTKKYLNRSTAPSTCTLRPHLFSPLMNPLTCQSPFYSSLLHFPTDLCFPPLSLCSHLVPLFIFPDYSITFEAILYSILNPTAPLSSLRIPMKVTQLALSESHSLLSFPITQTLLFPHFTPAIPPLSTI